MKKKKLIPKPPVEQPKVFTSWGYSFQNGGEVPSFEKGGKLQNGVMLYQLGNVVKARTDRTAPIINVKTTANPDGGQTTTTYSYKGTSVDHVNTPSAYFRGGRGQSQQTIDKNKQAMATIRSRFKDAKTQQDVVKLVNTGAIKPYEAQLLLQAIGSERSDAIGQTGEFSDQYKVDPETGIPFKVSNGIVMMQRNELNRLFQEKAKAGDKRFKGWENLREDMDYETGMLSKSESETPPPPPPNAPIIKIKTVQTGRDNIEVFVSRIFPNGKVDTSKYDLDKNKYSRISGMVDKYTSLDPKDPGTAKAAAQLEQELRRKAFPLAVEGNITADQAAQQRSDQVVNRTVQQILKRSPKLDTLTRDRRISDQIIRFTTEKLKEFVNKQGRDINAVFDNEFILSFLATYENQILAKANELKNGNTTI